VSEGRVIAETPPLIMLPEMRRSANGKGVKKRGLRHYFPMTVRNIDRGGVTVDESYRKDWTNLRDLCGKPSQTYGGKKKRSNKKTIESLKSRGAQPDVRGKLAKDVKTG